MGGVHPIALRLTDLRLTDLDLTTADRRSLPKLGDKSRAFIDHGLVLASQNSGILPRNFDLDQYS